MCYCSVKDKAGLLCIFNSKDLLSFPPSSLEFQPKKAAPRLPSEPFQVMSETLRYQAGVPACTCQ